MKKTVLEQTGKQVQDLLNRIEPDYNNLNKKIDDNTTTLESKIKENKDNISANFKTLDNKINDSTTKVNKNTSDISTLQSKMTSAESSIGINTSKINGLATRVEKNEKDIKNIGALDFTKLQEDLKKAQPVLDSFEDTVISGANFYNKALYTPKTGYFNMIPILADGSLVKS